MAQINVDIAGKTYPLTCAEGDQDRLRKLAAYVDGKATELTGQLGHVSETRLLLMAAVLIADELHDSLEGKGQPSPMTVGVSEEEMASVLNDVASNIEAVADRVANA